VGHPRQHQKPEAGKWVSAIQAVFHISDKSGLLAVVLFWLPMLLNVVFISLGWLGQRVNETGLILTC
jgi:hypothetical protein